MPIGSVRAEGWLLKQLQLQKEGLTGHAESLYGGSNDLGAGSDWLGGNGDSWERVPYYTKGLVALAYVLDDQDLIDRAQKWIDWSVRNNYGNGFNEYEVFPTSAWNYALSIDKNNPESSFQVNKKPMPENPYEQALTPVTLTVDAKRLNAWTLAFNGRIANDPPYGPVETESSRVYKVTLVPYGAETLRATVSPIIGNNVMITDEFTEDFEDG